MVKNTFSITSGYIFFKYEQKNLFTVPSIDQ